MYESPGSLQDCCIGFICRNLEAVCYSHEIDGQSRLAFSNQEVFFHDTISDSILSNLSVEGNLSDDTIHLFCPDVTRLKRVRLQESNLYETGANCKFMTREGLQILSKHNIQELEAIGFTSLTVSDFIESLNPNSLQSLRYLNFSRTAFSSISEQFGNASLIAKLKNLRTLNLSYTRLKQQGLKSLSSCLPSLENLDISCTDVTNICFLESYKNQLKSLCLYNVQLSNSSEEPMETLSKLWKLKHLDISSDNTADTSSLDSLPREQLDIKEILTMTHSLKNLTSLDVSGRGQLEDDEIREYLEDHPNIQFIGLLGTECTDQPCFTDTLSPDYRPDLKVTSCVTESHLMEALHRYSERHLFVRKILYHLFLLTQEVADPCLDMIKAILRAMKQNLPHCKLQIAATACLYNLTRSKLGKKVHPHWLRKIIGLTLDAMNYHRKALQLQKNALLILCSDTVLQDVTFERLRCARLVMECLSFQNDQTIIRMAVAICSILAAKIPTEEMTQLGANRQYMKQLLAIVQNRTASHYVDVTMRFTLSALWNLTDESPATCQVFLNEGGLQLCLKALKEFTEAEPVAKKQVETKVLGLFNNLAEVKSLRQCFFSEGETLPVIRNLLHSDLIDVQYFAGGILAHLASDGEALWLSGDVTYRQILQELGDSVKSWEQPENEMVSYRSFKPFFPLLMDDSKPQVQLWAAWAIHHVCSKNGSKYCSMLIDEDGKSLIENLTSPCHHDTWVNDIATNILQLCKQHCQTSH